MADTFARKPTSPERAARFMDAAAGLTVAEILAAADVLRAIADVDLGPLERAMTCDGYGNPIRDTEEQRDAWATYCAAVERRDRAIGWVLELGDAAHRMLTSA